jgi:hypothetical protein
LRRLRPNASPNPRTSCHVVEKERQCDNTHIAQNRGWQKYNVQTRPYRQTKVCFNLALPINVVKPAKIHAKVCITTQHDSKEIVISIARQARGMNGTNKARKPRDDASKNGRSAPGETPREGA